MQVVILVVVTLSASGVLYLIFRVKRTTNPERDWRAAAYLGSIKTDASFEDAQKTARDFNAISETIDVAVITDKEK